MSIIISVMRHSSGHYYRIKESSYTHTLKYARHCRRERKKRDLKQHTNIYIYILIGDIIMAVCAFLQQIFLLLPVGAFGEDAFLFCESLFCTAAPEREREREM